MLQRVRQRVERKRKKLAQVARCAALGQLASPEEIEQDQAEVNAAAARFGLMPVFQQEPTEPLYIWPENVASWNFFQRVSTQWHVGPGGAVGLNYAGVDVTRKALSIRRKAWAKLFSEVQVMERATLDAWREKKK